MKFLLIPLFVIMIIFVTPAYGMPPPPPTDFTVTIMDETNSKINLPAYLQVTEILNGETLQTYQLDLFENPQSISVSWAVPSRDANTEIHIVAIKQGFENSDEFIFKITSQTPQEGTLFEHDFILKTEETSKIIDKKFDITAILKKLYRLGYRNTLIEGGNDLTNHLLKKKLFNQFYLLKSPKRLSKLTDFKEFTGLKILKKNYKNKIKLKLNFGKDKVTLHKN